MTFRRRTNDSSVRIKGFASAISRVLQELCVEMRRTS